MVRITIISCVVIILSGCFKPLEDDGKNIFYYNESAGITSLDPAQCRDLENMWAVNQLFDGLVELDSAMQVKPLIARSWDIVEGGTTYVFHLRNDVLFHDNEVFEGSKGRRVVAADFVYSFNRIVDASVASPGKWVFAQVDFDTNTGFEAPNDSTFIVHLKQPFPPFLGMLTMQYCVVLPHEAIDYFGADFRANPVGCGPFKFAFWYENVALVYHRNAAFWQRDESGKSLPYLDAVKIDFVKDMSTEYLGLLKGDYDFMSGIHPAYKDELLDPFGQLSATYSDRLKFQKTPFIKTDYLGILVDDSLQLSTQHPLHDKRLRQALNMAIDRKEMVRYMRNNAVYPAGHGFIPRGLPSHNESASYGYQYDPERARALLAEAGFPEGMGLPVIGLSTTSDYVDLCEYIQHQLGEIGIKIQVDVLPSSAQREAISKSQVMLFRKSWLADYADAENFLGLFYSGNF